jgi:hypothetical protein
MLSSEVHLWNVHASWSVVSKVEMNKEEDVADFSNLQLGR